MQNNQKTHQTSVADTLFVLLACVTLLTPLFFVPEYLGPFENAKFLAFLLLTELTLPAYLWVHFSRRRQLVCTRHPIPLSLMALIVAMVVAAAFGVDPFNSFFGNALRPTGVILYLHLALLTCYLYEIFTTRPRWSTKLTDLVIASATFAALYGVLESWFLPAFVSMDERSASVFGNPILFSSFLTLPLFLCLSRTQESRVKHKKFFACCAAIILTAILLSGTRGALVGLISGSLFWLVIKKIQGLYSWKKLWLVLGVSFVSVLCVGLLIRIFVPNDQPVVRLTDFTGTNVQARLTYWGLGVQGWLHDPLMGVGSENFYAITNRLGDKSPSTFTTPWPDKAHNALIGRLAGMGLLGIGAYLSLLFFLYRNGLRSHNPSCTAILAGVSAYLTQHLFVFETVSGLILFFFVIAWIAAQQTTNASTNDHRQNVPLMDPVRAGFFFLGTGTTIILIFGFLIPTHTFLLNIGRGNRIAAQNPSLAAAYYQAAESVPFIWDLRPLAKSYSNLLKTNTQDSDSETDFQTKIFEKGRLTFARLLAKHPLRAQYWNELGEMNLLFAVKQNGAVAQDGIDATKRASELAPQNPKPIQTFGYMLLQNGDTEHALTIAEDLKRRFPDDADSAWFLGQVLYKQQNFPQAAAVSYQAIRMGAAPTNTDVLFWLVEYFSRQQTYDNVIVLYKMLIETQPENLPLLANLAATYARAGQIENATETANILKQKDPASAQAVESFLQSLKTK